MLSYGIVFDLMTQRYAFNVFNLKKLILFSDKVVITLNKYFLRRANINGKSPFSVIKYWMPRSNYKIIDFNHLCLRKYSCFDHTLNFHFVFAYQVSFFNVFQFLFKTYILILMVQSPYSNKALPINTSTIVSVVRAHINRGWFINDVLLFFS